MPPNSNNNIFDRISAFFRERVLPFLRAIFPTLVMYLRCRLKRPVIMLPLKLEIRKLETKNDSTIRLADFKALKKQNTRVVVNEKSFSKKEYWIRWYPDEIHVPIPIGKITKGEKKRYLLMLGR